MHTPKQKGFTLIELLTVMAVIVILSAMVLSLIGYVNKKAARSRAEGEIAGLSSALENFKSENGIYPTDADTATAGSYTRGDTDKLDARLMGSPTATEYLKASTVLYRALSGDRNGDRKVDATDQGFNFAGTTLTPGLTAVPTVYYSAFTQNQLSPAGGTGKVTAFLDPFGFAYGYSTAYQGDLAVNSQAGTTTQPTHGYNATFDLWSTASKNSTTTTQLAIDKPAWITNFPNKGQ